LAARALHKGILKVARAASLLAALGLPLLGRAAPGDLAYLRIGALAPAFSAPAADGRRHALNDYTGRIVVLEWTSPVCPYTAVKYDSGAMQALQRYAAAHRIIWLSIDTAAPDRQGYLTPAAARARIARTQATVSAFLFDKDTHIARVYGAKTTPSFFIIDREGKLAYQGAMDTEATPEHADTQNYVRDALAALLSGAPIATPESPQRGCAVEY
jgi:peroxiredoxin